MELGGYVRCTYLAGDEVNVFLWPTAFHALSGSGEQLQSVPCIASEVCEKEGNKQSVNQVDEKGADQWNNNERHV